VRQPSHLPAPLLLARPSKRELSSGIGAGRPTRLGLAPGIDRCGYVRCPGRGGGHDRNRIAIQDYWQGRGRGPILLDEILRADEAQGPPSGASLTSPMKWTPW